MFFLVSDMSSVSICFLAEHACRCLGKEHGGHGREPMSPRPPIQHLDKSKLLESGIPEMGARKALNLVAYAWKLDIQ